MSINITFIDINDVLNDSNCDNEFKKYNNANIYNLFPYKTIDDILYIDDDWWKSLSNIERDIILEKLGIPETMMLYSKYYSSKRNNNEQVKIKFEKNIRCDTFLHPYEKKIYEAYANCFDYNIWYNPNIINGPQNVKLIKIPEREKCILRDITRMRWNNNLSRKISGSAVEDLEVLHEILDRNIYQTCKYMIRLSSCSPKHDFNIYPVETSIGVLDYITKSRKFLNREYEVFDKDTYIICIKWNDYINNEGGKRCEFRLFYYNKKVVAVSQQFWNAVFNYTQEEINIIKNLVFNPPFVNYIPYNTCVFDTYIDFNKKEIYLIECNPYYCSGSALFNYISDNDLLFGKKDKQELRILTKKEKN